MPTKHSDATKAKMRASAKRSWQSPQIREARINGLRASNASRRPAQVLVRQPGSPDQLLAVTGWENGTPVIELGPDGIMRDAV